MNLKNLMNLKKELKLKNVSILIAKGGKENEFRTLNSEKSMVLEPDDLIVRQLQKTKDLIITEELAPTVSLEDFCRNWHDGRAVPPEIRSCCLEALAGETFPCLTGEEVWQVCYVCFL